MAAFGRQKRYLVFVFRLWHSCEFILKDYRDTGEPGCQYLQEFVYDNNDKRTSTRTKSWSSTSIYKNTTTTSVVILIFIQYQLIEVVTIDITVPIIDTVPLIANILIFLLKIKTKPPGWPSVSAPAPSATPHRFTWAAIHKSSESILVLWYQP